MPIKLAPIGVSLVIKRVSADEKVKRHLEDLGLYVGQQVELLSSQGGAVILKLKEGRIALDAKMATGIFVA
ncbi:MAG: ferrous iron transport protein A [Clostridia bacterium]|nr:ferrous iron transport protein A [Clostridia bacterium]